MRIEMAVDSKRLFFALWPAAAVRRQITLIDRTTPHPNARWITADNFHVTLVFLGQVPNTEIAMIVAAVDEIRRSAFSLTLDTLVSKRSANMLWVLPSNYSHELFSLQSSLVETLAPLGFEPEARRYIPHVTLARRYGGLLRNNDIGPIEWSVREFSLVESVSEKLKTRYVVRTHWVLND